MSQVRKRRKLSLLTALMTMLTVLVFPTGTALAADIAIDCASDDLQATIDGATSGDTIIIADGSTCTGNFNVNKPLTIRAATGAGATLDGADANLGPVVNVTATGDVTLQDLTITGGLNTAPNAGLGGGVAVGGLAVVTITDSDIDTNSADNGGGIYNAGTLTIDGGSISSNTAGDGGGAYNKGTMSVENGASVDTNMSTAPAGGGGGIWNDAMLTVDSSVIDGNTSVDAGGGIQNISGGILLVTSSDVTNNTAAVAGGILNNGTGDTGSTATISNSSVDGNSATRLTGGPPGGGGIYNLSFPTDTTKASLIVDQGSTVSGNTSAAEGAGGIRNADGDATLDGAIVTGNIAVGSGGGIRTSESMTITDSDISDNMTDSAGGGIALDGGDPGPPVVPSTLTVTGSTINNNTAAADGGGISSGQTTSLMVIESSITRNTAMAGAGLSNAGTATVTNSTLSGNMASAQGGGLHTSGPLTVSYSTVSANNATSEGGGVRVIGVPVVTLTGTILHGNTSVAGPDCSGPVAGGGFNLVGVTAPPCVYTGTASDLAPGSDPMLSPLGFYTEATEHHPLLTGSDAIDGGGACGLANDQIGATRPDGPLCDVGAIEGASVAPPATADDVLLVEPNGRWHIRMPGNPDYTFFYGVPGDIPLFGDWDGDGFDTPGAWRQGPGGGFAYLTNTLPPDAGSGVAEFDFFFGIPGDEVFVGDWNGDGEDTLGINRLSHMFLTDTNGSDSMPVPTHYDFFFGVPGDRAFGGDADANGRDAVFLYRAADGFVYYTNETPVGPSGVAATADNFFFGIASDSFVSGDWDADTVDTAGIFRGSDTTVYLSNTNASGGAPAPTDVQYVWGTAGWFPVSGVHGVT